ncbi:MAG: porin [Sulfuricella sp.]
MNKKLIALAVAAALAPAAAMADSGNVTIYGVMDASVDVTNNGDGSTTMGGPVNNGVRDIKISSNNSRLGFKGNEDLGNGTSAVWQLESTIGSDGTPYALSTRNTFLGLSNKAMGALTLGRQDSPYKVSTRGYDFFTDGLADNRNLMGGGTTGNGKIYGAPAIAATNPTFPAPDTSATPSSTTQGSVTSFDNRWADSMVYNSPNMSGFKAAVAYAAVAENATLNSQTKGKAWSLAGMYDNGPLTASLAYERHSYGSTGNTNTNHPVFGQNSYAGQTEKAWKLGAGYSFGDLMVNGVFEKTSDNFATSLGHKAYTLGAKYKIGSNDLKLAYTKAGDLAGIANSSAKQWALGVDHHMSKRTKVFAQYVKLSNNTNAQYGLTGANASGNVYANGYDADPAALQVGMRHLF